MVDIRINAFFCQLNIRLKTAQHDTLLYEKWSEKDTRLKRCLISERVEAATFVVQVTSALNM
jgi:hypothetical protein